MRRMVFSVPMMVYTLQDTISQIRQALSHFLTISNLYQPVILRECFLRSSILCKCMNREWSHWKPLTPASGYWAEHALLNHTFVFFLTLVRGNLESWTRNTYQCSSRQSEIIIRQVKGVANRQSIGLLRVVFKLIKTSVSYHRIFFQ